MQERSYHDEYDLTTGVLKVSGTVDETHTDRLEESVARCTGALEGGAPTRDLVIDLTGVDFLPSAAIGVLAVAVSRAKSVGVSVELVSHPSSTSYRALQITGLPFTTAG